MDIDDLAAAAPAMCAEWERMISGQLYRPEDAGLVAARRKARQLTRMFNQSGEDDVEDRRRLLEKLLGALGPRAEVEPPFHCDYGCNIQAGERLFMNFGCVILDCARVDIGSRVLIGPGVHIYAATHPLDPETRAAGSELARPVRIGNDVWIGGGAIICPGVTIGNGSTIGAGSVVVRDIPDRVVATGNPCRVTRSLEAVDRH